MKRPRPPVPPEPPAEPTVLASALDQLEKLVHGDAVAVACEDCTNPREYRVWLAPFTQRPQALAQGWYHLCGPCARGYDDYGHVLKAWRL